jgi:predicted patatin/cPLA2 family phospholipase
MINEINHALDIYRTKRYEVISGNIMKVDRHEVIKKISKNRVIFLCDCDNANKSDNLGFCRHKFFYLMFPLLERLDSKLWDLESYYKTMKSITKDPEQKRIYEIFLDQLIEIKRIKI